jgi:hypothetical protein
MVKNYDTAGLNRQTQVRMAENYPKYRSATLQSEVVRIMLKENLNN